MRVLLGILAMLLVGLCILFNDPSGKIFVFYLVFAIVVGLFLFVIKAHQGDAPAASLGQYPSLRVESVVSSGRASAQDDSGYLDAARSVMYGVEEGYFQELEYLKEVRTLPPIAFERYVAYLFRGQGYTTELTKRSGDQGVDIFVSKDGKKGIVQCKQQKASVGQPTLRDLYGAMLHHQADEAYLVCTVSFTEPAQVWGKDKPIHLIDGRALMKWVRGYGASSPLTQNSSLTSDGSSPTR